MPLGLGSKDSPCLATEWQKPLTCVQFTETQVSGFSSRWPGKLFRQKRVFYSKRATANGEGNFPKGAERSLRCQFG